MSYKAVVLTTVGTNRAEDAACAVEVAGGSADIVLLSDILNAPSRLLDYAMLIFPGGFTHGDHLGAGRMWAHELRHLDDDLDAFITSGRPVIGICNGFQALAKSSLAFPWPTSTSQASARISLAPNSRGTFECRWVDLMVDDKSPCIFTRGISTRIRCPVAHGEGRVIADDVTLAKLEDEHLVPLRYLRSDTADGYPGNPNGSALDAAGVCNAAGNVLGLMPHPENALFAWQPPAPLTSSSSLGLVLFENGMRHARSL